VGAEEIVGIGLRSGAALEERAGTGVWSGVATEEERAGTVTGAPIGWLGGTSTTGSTGFAGIWLAGATGCEIEPAALGAGLNVCNAESCLAAGLTTGALGLGGVWGAIVLFAVPRAGTMGVPGLVAGVETGTVGAGGFAGRVGAGVFFTAGAGAAFDPSIPRRNTSLLVVPIREARSLM
jgi:hypothetical protein